MQVATRHQTWRSLLCLKVNVVRVCTVGSILVGFDERRGTVVIGINGSCLEFVR